VVITNIRSSANKPVLSRTEIGRMFDRIASRYDLLNHLLSFGQDVMWRNSAVKHLSDKPDQIVLDAATGTGEMLLALLRKNSNIKAAVGIDMSENMLTVGLQKIKKRRLNNTVMLMPGDAGNIPFIGNSCDAVTMAFGIRNVSNVQAVLKDIYRVLKKKGKVIILEFSLPENKFIKRLYLFHFRRILPVMGTIISGYRYAYRYLNQTVESFPYGIAFCELLLDAGFQNVYNYPMTFGIVTIYCGEKP